jgi:hypothetical protein
MRHDNFLPLVRRRSRGRLPHWEVDDADYFVTFRLRDSLPRDIARQLLIEREYLVQTAQTDAERVTIDKAFGITFMCCFVSRAGVSSAAFFSRGSRTRRTRSASG